jgi:hypothetical protein
MKNIQRTRSAGFLRAVASLQADNIRRHSFFIPNIVLIICTLLTAIPQQNVQNTPKIVFNGTNPFYSFVQNLPFLGEFYPFWGSANMTHIPKTLICSLSIDFQRAVAEPLGQRGEHGQTLPGMVLFDTLE